MFRDNPKFMAAGAFVAGGILVGGITFATTAAHGAGSGGGGKGLSSAEYTAKYAFVQEVSNIPTALNVPAGDRLTITNIVNNDTPSGCSITATLNGVSAIYIFQEQDGDGSSSANITPVSLDSGAVHCGYSAAVIGYVTPMSTS